MMQRFHSLLRKELFCTKGLLDISLYRVDLSLTLIQVFEGAFYFFQSLGLL